MAQPIDPVSAQAFGFEVHDPQKFAQNMARLVEETGKAVSAFVEPRVTDPTRALMPDDLTRIMNAFAQVQQAWMVHPLKLMRSQADLWQRYWTLWSSHQRLPAGRPHDQPGGCSRSQGCAL